VLVLGPLAAGFIWPHVAERFKTVDVTAAVVQGSGRRDVFVSGFIDDPATPSMGTQKLSIQEPNRQRYERLVAISPERTFEIILGEPVAGRYAVTVHWRGRDRDGKDESHIPLPDLVVGEPTSADLPKAQARSYDYQRLFLLSLGGLASLLVISLFLRRQREISASTLAPGQAVQPLEVPPAN
jgi:hypothetical protein